MRIIYIISVLICFFLSSCNSNNNSDNIQFNEESSEIIKNGISFSSSNQNIELKCIHDSKIKLNVVTVISDKAQIEWVSTAVQNLSETESIIRISVLSNDETKVRNAEIYIYAGDKCIVIPISQACKGVILVDNLSHVVSNCETHLKICCSSTEEISLRIVSELPNWINIESIETKDKHNYTVNLNINKNIGFGRIAKLILEAPNAISSSITIRQQPRIFLTNEVLNTNGEGKLGVLLGDDIDNIRNIRSITINGSLNEYDIESLKQLFIPITNRNYTKYHINLDLSLCTFENKEIPEELFKGAANLTGLILPENTVIIGKESLADCISLKKITIPDEVKYLRYGVFKGCKNLDKINIGKGSQFLSVDGYVFNTGSTIESLYLPECLYYINKEAFAACSVKEFYVNWNVPPTLNILPNPNICTLYVPFGSLEKYQSSDNWKRFIKIIESTD